MTSLHETAVAEAIRIVSGIADGQLSNPTPCAEFTVRTELNHLYQVVELMVDVAHGMDID
ncbi:MAG: maleylpyruvate isomerase N-terminal domain-containing protein, partial [Stackebrandtia sp.]